MRVRIRTTAFDMTYEGRAALWNEFLRPLFGGPEAVDLAPRRAEPESARTPAAPERRPPAEVPPRRGEPQPGVRPAAPARPPAQRPQPAPVPEPVLAVPAEEIFAQLAAAGGRRADKDAVLVAVWLRSRGVRSVAMDDVVRWVNAQPGFRETRVKPLLLKHVNRSKMLLPGEDRDSVQLSPKGRRYVAQLLA